MYKCKYDIEEEENVQHEHKLEAQVSLYHSPDINKSS